MIIGPLATLARRRTVQVTCACFFRLLSRVKNGHTFLP